MQRHTAAFSTSKRNVTKRFGKVENALLNCKARSVYGLLLDLPDDDKLLLLLGDTG